MRDADAVILIGRRPGTFAAVLDLEAPEATGADVPSDRGPSLRRSCRDRTASAVHHRDGRALPARARPCCAMRATFAPRARFDAGIEPHDVLFARGGEVLVVAVGGIARAADVKGPRDQCRPDRKRDPRARSPLGRGAEAPRPAGRHEHASRSATWRSRRTARRSPSACRIRIAPWPGPSWACSALGRGIDLLPLPAGRRRRASLLYRLGRHRFVGPLCRRHLAQRRPCRPVVARRRTLAWRFQARRCLRSCRGRRPGVVLGDVGPRRCRAAESGRERPCGGQRIGALPAAFDNHLLRS